MAGKPISEVGWGCGSTENPRKHACRIYVTIHIVPLDQAMHRDQVDTSHTDGNVESIYNRRQYLRFQPTFSPTKNLINAAGAPRCYITRQPAFNLHLLKWCRSQKAGGLACLIIDGCDGSDLHPTPIDTLAKMTTNCWRFFHETHDEAITADRLVSINVSGDNYCRWR